MNKFIKTDLEQAASYMKAAIMNALHDIDSGEERAIGLGDFIPWPLFVKCLKESGWLEDNDKYDTNGWQCDFWSFWESPSGKNVEISGSLWYGNYEIRVNHDDE